MEKLDITSIDISPYQSTPLLSTESTVSLADALNDARPKQAPDHVHKAAERMNATCDETREEFVERIENAGLGPASEAAFDVCTDWCWKAGHTQLEFWMLFESKAFDLLTPAQQVEIDLEGKRELASFARELDSHLFGAEGFAFLRKPYAQQVVLMASRLAYITQSEKAAQYAEVLGPELLTTLQVLQARYEAMVRARAVRDDSSVSLQTLRFKLQRHIQLYAAAVLTMLDEDDPKSGEVVINALRPMVNARLGRSKASSASANDGLAEGEAEASEGETELPQDDTEAELGNDNDE